VRAPSLLIDQLEQCIRQAQACGILANSAKIQAATLPRIEIVVVTNLKQSPQWIYEKTYCQRGDVENRIKELHDGMQIGRTSCSNFLANTFRVLLTAAAYVLIQEMRLHLSPTRHARAQVATLREHFLKLGAQVIVTARRIVLHLPQAFPYRDSFHRLALSLGAQTG
jgi:hypothetical protein